MIYVKQSSPSQVITNKESQRMQYALHERAGDFGWRKQDTHVIDADFGLSTKRKIAALKAGLQSNAFRKTFDLKLDARYDIYRLVLVVARVVGGTSSDDSQSVSVLCAIVSFL